MKKILLLLCLLPVFYAKAQQVSRVNFDAVKKETHTANSPFYYPNLLKRFQAGDSTLLAADFTYLYYGQVFTAGYSPYGSLDEKFTKAYNNGQYAEALPIGEKYIAANPLSLKMLFKLLVCQHELGNKAAAKAWAFRYYALIEAIMASGDGKSTQSAYVVTNVSDEYQVLATLKLNSSGQALVGRTDVLTVQPQNDKSAAPSEVYFDVSQPLGYLSREFNSKKK